MTKLDRKREVISQFNQIAHPFQFFAGEWVTHRAKRSEHDIVAILLAGEGNSPNKKALDAGCGVGGYFDILLDKAFHVVGFDIAENMVKVCRSRYGGRNNVEVVMADVEYLPFTPDSFHLVLCIDTLQYVDRESRRLTLQEMVKLVKPGNLIIIEVKNKYCPTFWLSKRRTGLLAQFYSIASVTSVLENSGCAIEAIRGVFWPTFLSPIVVVKARKSHA